MTSPSPQPNGRIWFPGNPWPNGHRIKSFRFGATITPDRGAWDAALVGKRPAMALDFELVTAAYDEEDTSDRDGSGATDWESKIVWNNYGSCRISSSATSDYPGILVSDGKTPFVFDLDEYSFTADPLPIEDIGDHPTKAAFGIYMLGHDSVADHRIHLHSRRPDGSYTVNWTGRVAMTYTGQDDTFEHAFRAHVEGVRFDAISMFYYDPAFAKEHFGIDLDRTMVPRDIIAPFVSDPDNFRFESRDPGNGEGVLHAVRRYPAAP
jgi:hypothetical protein